MPHRFRGVLDLVRETDKVLEEAARAAANLVTADPVDRNSAAHRVKTLIANARTANAATRTSLEEHDPPRPPPLPEPDR